MSRLALCAAALAALLVAGCNNGGNANAGSLGTAISPLVGKWAGKSDVKGGDLAKFANSVAGGPLTGPSTLTLNGDGTGLMKVADQAERPVSWRQEGDSVILETRGVNGKDEVKASGDGPWVGHLSSDKKTMTIDMEKVKVTLDKHEGG